MANSKAALAVRPGRETAAGSRGRASRSARTVAAVSAKTTRNRVARQAAAGREPEPAEDELIRGGGAAAGGPVLRAAAVAPDHRVVLAIIGLVIFPPTRHTPLQRVDTCRLPHRAARHVQRHRRHHKLRVEGLRRIATGGRNRPGFYVAAVPLFSRGPGAEAPRGALLRLFGIAGAWAS